MPSWTDVLRIAKDLPEVEESDSHGTPCLRAHGQVFAVDGSRVAGHVVIWCAQEEKAALLASDDPTFVTAPHYDGHGSILVDLSTVDRDQLTELVVDAWRLRVPVKVRKAYDER